MTPIKRGPHMDDCPGMGELTAQTPADQVTYGGWTPPRKDCSAALDAVLSVVELGPGLFHAHEAIHIAAGHALISDAELAALRKDRERLGKLIEFLNHYYLFAVYVKLQCPNMTADAMSATKAEWFAAIDAARGAK